MRKDATALTLIELVVVIAVAMGVFALLMPLIGQYFREGRSADDLVRLRQLGVSAALYADEHAARVGTCVDLIETRLAPKEMCASSLDPTAEGYANLVRELTGKLIKSPITKPTEFKMSFIGHRDQLASLNRLAKAEQGTTGWLIDVSKSEHEGPPAAINYLVSRVGSYRRLLDNGAVVVRRFDKIRYAKSEHEVSVCWSPHWLYGDFRREVLEDECHEYKNEQEH